MPIFYQSIDSETGEEIIIFSIPEYQMVRNKTTKRLIRKYKGEPLTTDEELITYQARNQGMVRDAETKRFIRGFNGVSIQVALLFKYPPEKAHHGNPLYVDVKTISFVGIELTDIYEKIEQELGIEARIIVNEEFGPDVSDRAEIVGVEHKLEVTKEVYPEYHWYLVWHHYKNDEREDDGVGRVR